MASISCGVLYIHVWREIFWRAGVSQKLAGQWRGYSGGVIIEAYQMAESSSSRRETSGGGGGVIKQSGGEMAAIGSAANQWRRPRLRLSLVIGVKWLRRLSAGVAMTDRDCGGIWRLGVSSHRPLTYRRRRPVFNALLAKRSLEI